jgi:hypothetical protein
MITMSLEERLGLRWPTMSLALELLETRGGHNIVETGCAREADSWAGDGMSTLVFAEWIRDHNGHLWTVDADPGNLATCKILTAGYEGICYVLDDSVHFLSEHWEPIDLLYLDSFDYPLVELINLYGDLAKFPETIARLNKLGDDYIVANHADIIGDSQRHAEREIRAAQIHDQTIVLIDDASLPGGGKARLAKQFLAETGWTCLMDAYQTLWVKP